MLSVDRQTKLDQVLESLRKIEGVQSVQSDDWDSTNINVFIRLKEDSEHADRAATILSNCRPIFKFENSIRYIKNRTRRRLEDMGVLFSNLDQPTMQYSTMQVDRKRETYRDGYDQDTIKIEVCIPA